MSIQSSVNSMIGTVTGSVMAARRYNQMQKIANAKGARLMSTQNDAADTQSKGQQSVQAQAAQVARQSSANEIAAKKAQRKQIDQLVTSFGGKVSDLPESVRQKVYEVYSNGSDK